MTTPAPVAPTSTGSVIGRYRWRICAVLFMATTINYIDRNVFSFTMLDTTFRHQMLGIPLGQALLFITRVGYLDDGRAIEITHTWCRSDYYDFVAELRR